MKIKLSKKYDFGQELEFDFENLNGISLIKAEREAKRHDPGVVMLATSLNYQVAVAGQACKTSGVTAENLKALYAKDFNRVVQASQAFLLGVDSEEQDQDQQSLEN